MVDIQVIPRGNRTDALQLLGWTEATATPQVEVALQHPKCTLIATFFMHLKTENRNITFTILVALFFVIVLVGALIPDIGIVHK